MLVNLFSWVEYCYISCLNSVSKYEYVFWFYIDEFGLGKGWICVLGCLLVWVDY